MMTLGVFLYALSLLFCLVQSQLELETKVYLTIPFQTVHKGARVGLLCFYLEGTTGEVIWEFENKPVDGYTEVIIRDFDQVYKLILPQVDYSDAGTYTCKAVGRNGPNYRSSTVLRVVGRREYPVQCQTIEDPPHAYVMTTGTIPSSMALYSCLPGFIVDTFAITIIRECLANGSWSASPPICELDREYFDKVFSVTEAKVLQTELELEKVEETDGNTIP